MTTPPPPPPRCGFKGCYGIAEDMVHLTAIECSLRAGETCEFPEEHHPFQPAPVAPEEG